MIKYLPVREAGEKWGVSGRRVAMYCAQGRMDGALKKGNLWLVPNTAEKPPDARQKKGTHGVGTRR